MSLVLMNKSCMLTMH